MTWLDYALIGVLVISVAWGVWRGLVREAISLAGWVIAFLVANLFAAPLAELLTKSLPRPEWHLPLAFVVIFLLTLTLATLVGDRKSTRLNSSHIQKSRMPSSA